MPRVSRDTVRTIYVARAVALAVLIAAIWALHWTAVPTIPASAWSAIVLLALLPTLLTLAWPGDVPSPLLILGFAVDILAVTAGIHFGGGIDPPLAPFLYAMIVAAISLLFPMRVALVAATASAAAYAGVLWLEHAAWLPPVAPLAASGQRVATRIILVTLYLHLVAWVVSYAVSRLTAGLRRSEERFALAVAGANDGIWDHDLVHDVLYLSPRWKAMLGFADHELPSTAEAWLSRIHPDDARGLDALVPPSTAREHHFQLEYRLRHRDDTYRWVLVRGIVVTDAAGRPVRMSGSLTDIGDRREANMALQRQKAQLEQHAQALEEAVDGLERFGYAISHHLRGPLRAIDGFTTAVLDEQGACLDADGRSDLQRVRAAAGQMGQLIDAFVRLSRLGHGALQIEDVDLSAAAQRIAARLAGSEPQRGVVWSIEPGVTARGDAALFAIALRHLLENAWKFTATHPRSHIEFGMQLCDGQRIYFVRDDGVGFDMEHAEKLFEPFERLHGREEFPGIGMGLVTVQRIVRRHRGHAWAEGAVERGATFYFTLDADTPEQQDAET